MKTNLFHPQNKSKVLSVAVLAIAFATVATGTLAYFTDSTIAHNVITSGAVKIDLIEKQRIPGGTDGDEDTYVDYPEDTITGVMPGSKVSKIVTVQNNEQKAWVRVQVTPTITLAGEGTPSGNVGYISFDFDTENWEKGEDNYWYYKTPLGTGEETTPLFTTVTFSKEMGNEYQNCTVTIAVAAEAIQHANMTKDAMASQGWEYMEAESTTGAASEA